MENTTGRFLKNNRKMHLGMSYFHSLRESTVSFEYQLSQDAIDKDMLRSIWHISNNEIYLREILLNINYHQEQLETNAEKISIEELFEILKVDLEKVSKCNIGSGPCKEFFFVESVNLDKKDNFVFYQAGSFLPIFNQIFCDLKHFFNILSEDSTYFFRAGQNGTGRFVEVGYKIKKDKKTKADMIIKMKPYTYSLVAKVYNKLFSKKIKRVYKNGEFFYSIFI